VHDDTHLYPRQLREREKQALQLVLDWPGITVAELQNALGATDAKMRKIVTGLRGQVRFEQPPLHEPQDFEPRVAWRSETPADVRRARERAAEEDQSVAAIIATRSGGHIATYGMALDTIAELHQRIADGTNIDLTGDTRWAAMWQLAGRMIGYARALMVLGHAGFGDEAMPIARAQHECSRLLEAVTNRHETDLLIRWLADDDERYVRPRDARDAIERGEKLIAEMMIAAGEPAIPSTRDLSADLYHRMSVVTHNRRQATQSVLAPAQRSMARGRHPNPYGRATAVRWLGTVVEEAVAQVGGCLVSFLGETASTAWIAETLQPTLETFRAVERDQPLDARSVQLAALRGDTS
jgi:hypothetical protein